MKKILLLGIVILAIIAVWFFIDKSTVYQINKGESERISVDEIYSDGSYKVSALIKHKESFPGEALPVRATVTNVATSSLTIVDPDGDSLEITVYEKSLLDKIKVGEERSFAIRHSVEKDPNISAGGFVLLYSELFNK